MSVLYFLACHDCQKVIDIGQYGGGGFTFYSGEPDCMAKLEQFVEFHTFHHDHKLAIVQEQYPEDETYDHIEWETRKK